MLVKNLSICNVLANWTVNIRETDDHDTLHKLAQRFTWTLKSALLVNKWAFI